MDEARCIRQAQAFSVWPCADFRTIGGIVTLFNLLDSKHAGLRAGSAEALAAIAQNYPQAQLVSFEPSGMSSLCDQQTCCAFPTVFFLSLALS